MAEPALPALSADTARLERGFSADLETAQRALFDPGSSRAQRAGIVMDWVRDRQPCRFARLAAAQGRMDIAILDERDLAVSDDVLALKIARLRARWLRRAFRGQSLGFVLLAVGRSLAYARPDSALREIALRLASCYSGKQVRVDEIVLDDVFYPIDQANADRWQAPLNFFAAQADGRWWHERRIPGGIGFSINSIGHAMRILGRERGLSEGQIGRWALAMARQTIAGCTGGFVELDSQSSAEPGYRASFDTDCAVPAVLFEEAGRPHRQRRFALTTDFSSAGVTQSGRGWSSPECRARGAGTRTGRDEIPTFLDASAPRLEPRGGDCR